MYRVPAVIGALLDAQPAPPRRISNLTIVLTVISGLDGGSYLVAALLLMGLGVWAEVGSSGRMFGVFIGCVLVGLASSALLVYRAATLVSTARHGTALAIAAVGTPARARPTFTPWGDMSGIGDRQGAGSYEISYRVVGSGEQGSIRLQEAWLRSLADGSPLWLLANRRYRLLAPRRG